MLSQSLKGTTAQSLEIDMEWYTMFTFTSSSTLMFTYTHAFAFASQFYFHICNTVLSFPQCAPKNHTTAQNPKMLGVIRDHPEIEDIIQPVGEVPLDLPTEDHFTHIVADTVLAVNEEHYSVIYLGTGEVREKAKPVMFLWICEVLTQKSN